MPVTFVSGDLFLSSAQTLGHGCNARGFMGRGIALAFKTGFPGMYDEYERQCITGELRPGGYFLWNRSDRWALNLCTQDDRTNASPSFIEGCLVNLAINAKREGITSLALPQLGCGLGGIEWSMVKPMIHAILDPLPIPIEVYEHYEPGVRACG